MNYRTDLAMERTVYPGGLGDGVTVQTQQDSGAEITWVRVQTEAAAQRLGKPVGTYWTMTHPELPTFTPKERMQAARRIAQMLRLMLPPTGDVLVLGLGNRRMTADALAAMETGHIGTTVQLTDAGICPGSGVGNHRAAINRETMHVPVIAVGVPMVVYASTIVRDALQGILAAQSTQEDAHRMAEQLTKQAHTDLVVTPRNIDELVAGLADMLALAINSALQPSCTLEELSHYLH